MRVVSFAHARTDLKTVLDNVVDNDVTVIAREEVGDVVAMSIGHYNALIETMHLLRSPENARSLQRSIEQFKQNFEY